MTLIHAVSTFDVAIPTTNVAGKPVGLPGRLTLPESASGLVLFAHGSGSSRLSPRNAFVASELHDAWIGTLLFDLLTPQEETDRANVFDIRLLADRLLAAVRLVADHEQTRHLPLGLFGARTGAAAALVAAKAVPDRPHAIVLDTLMGRGVALFEQREKNHFIRVEPEEWAVARRQLGEVAS